MTNDHASSPRRIKAFHKGLRAEDQAADHFTSLGFEVVAKRYKTKSGEIDLIVQRETLVIFVEVKARASVNEGLESIMARAQRRIASAATQWMADTDHAIIGTVDYRFDVVVITPDHTLTHFENAFSM